MDKQKDKIEAEIQRRVADARKLMETELAGELEKQKQTDYKRQMEKEVCLFVINSNNDDKITINKSEYNTYEIIIIGTRLKINLSLVHY